MEIKVWLMVLISTPFFITACSSTSVEGEPVTAFDILEKTEVTEWDLVVLGDSDMDPAYMFYSDYYEEDLGINIVTHVKPDQQPSKILPIAWKTPKSVH